MDAKTVQIGRITADPTAAFRPEGSTITASDPTFDSVQLDSKTMSALVIGSMEWFQDAPNVSEVVEQAMAAAVVTQLDLVCLFGGVITGNEGISLATPPNPRGILATLLAQASSSVLGAAANGTAQTALTYWNEVIDTLFFPQPFNEMPNALLWNAKLAQQYAKGYDSQGQPLQAPALVGELEKFVTNQIPSFTSGTMTGRATDLFVGDFRQLLVGQRLTFTVQTLTERYAELGQIGIVAHWRGDVQLARPGVRGLPLPLRSCVMAAINPPDLLRVMEHEQRQRAQDRDAFERDAAGVRNVGTHADAYIHAVNADGEELVYVPGELLPDWVAEQVNVGRAPLHEAAAGVRVRSLERKQAKAKP